MSVVHGAHANLLPSATVPTANVNAGLPVVTGAVPAWQIDGIGANTGVLGPFYSLSDFKSVCGWSDNYQRYPGCEAADVFFNLYNVGPLVIINPLNASTKATTVAPATVSLVGGVYTIAANDIVLGTLSVKSSDGATTYALGTDYTAAYDADFNVVITRIAGGTIASGTASIKIAYSVIDDTALASNDIIGMIPAIDQVFPRLRMIPGQLLAPGWTHMPSVMAPLVAKSRAINNLFQAEVICDIPSSVTQYGQVAASISTNNYTDGNQINCWPKVSLGGQNYHMSLHIAALNCLQDSQHNDIPFNSPSNKALAIDGANLADDVTLAAGAQIFLGPETFTASLVPFVTAVNMLQWTAWGNYTGANAVSTDPNTFIPNIRMEHWVAKKLILTFWPIVDGPINTRLVETVVNSSNQWLNTLTAMGAIPGGKVTFDKALNNTTDLASGKLTITVSLGPDSPAQLVTFNINLDASFYAAIAA